MRVLVLFLALSLAVDIGQWLSRVRALSLPERAILSVPFVCPFIVGTIRTRHDHQVIRDQTVSISSHGLVVCNEVATVFARLFHIRQSASARARRQGPPVPSIAEGSANT